ncbi:MAG: prepilin-type N-terminal cleavage/methylation domain-containing protein [Rubrivivax sp.]|nr:MAG: prepilin-type N-terminal cleavage/methylation domain-containing protein [Rubrivivax sp.]
MKVQRGFSMIEIVVTIAIMGILMATAAPGMGDWLRNTKVRNAAESIQSGLQQARAEAVRRNRPVSFSLVSTMDNTCALSSANGSWVVSGDANPASHCGDAISSTVAPKLVAKGAMSDGGSAVVAATNAAGTAATTVTFNGFGMVSGASAIQRILVKSSDDAYQRRVEITTGGVSRVCDPTIMAGDTRACIQ